MATIELRKLISRNRNYGIAQKYPLSVINLLFQYVYGLFIMKSYYGMVHFDTQHRNLMATYIHNRDIKITEKIQSPYIIKEKIYCNKSFFLNFQTHLTSQNPRLTQEWEQNVPVFHIVLKNTGLLLKHL